MPLPPEVSKHIANVVSIVREQGEGFSWIYEPLRGNVLDPEEAQFVLRTLRGTNPESLLDDPPTRAEIVRLISDVIDLVEDSCRDRLGPTTEKEGEE